MIAIIACFHPSVAYGLIPAGLKTVIVETGFHNPVAMAFLPDGRMIVVEHSGMVHLVDQSWTQPVPVLNLVPEVGAGVDRGMTDVAVDPDFEENGYIYLLYTVDPVYGEPNEAAHIASFGRVTRYSLVDAPQGLVADESSRHVVLGRNSSDGIPVCDAFHSVGSLAFALDGSLFVSAGDGALAFDVDGGGIDAECFEQDLFDDSLDVGAFRSQSLDALAGKILRIHPDTGDGLPDNPFWNGDGTANASRIWAFGLRNPFRFTVRPGSQHPGMIVVADVGWQEWEELNFIAGGENLGWPCVEGNAFRQEFQDVAPAKYNCMDVAAAARASDGVNPVYAFHHASASMSSPPGHIMRVIIGGAFYEGDSYPSVYHGAYFFADYLYGWMRALLPDDSEDTGYLVFEFGSGLDGPVCIRTHPITGDLHYVSLGKDEIRKIVRINPDLTGDGVVGPGDVAIILGLWGACDRPSTCEPDLNGDGIIGASDLAVVLAFWTSDFGDSRK